MRPSNFPSIMNVADGSDIGAFELQNAIYTLTLNKAGSGDGTVTSAPSDISCGPLCTSDSAMYDQGQQVTLTATPAAGSDPATWGGCDSVNGSNQCIVAMSSNKLVTATFNLTPVPSPPAAAGPTGQQAAALNKCKRLKSKKKRKTCKKRARRLPV